MYTKLNIKGKGLWLFDDGKMLVYRRGELLLYDEQLTIINRCCLPIHGVRKIGKYSRYLERIVHCEPRFAIGVSENEILIQLDTGIYKYDVCTNTLKKESLKMTSRALSACKISDVEGFSDSIAIGDYGGNNQRAAVNIYQRSLKSDDWKAVYSFPHGSVRHIHGFYCDKENGFVYIMTGDLDSESGIWRAKDNFSSVEKVLVGTQQYRTCQMFAANNKIFYCTDAPSEPNYLYCFENENLHQICQLRGTCIFGVETINGYLFSTTCEPDVDTTKSLVTRMLNRKPGAGVVGRNVDLNYITRQGEIYHVVTYQNDGLPLRLMQYGTIQFSNCMDGKVLCTPVAVKGYDFHCFLFDEKETQK